MKRKPDYVFIQFADGEFHDAADCIIENWARENSDRRSYSGDGSYIAVTRIKVYLKEQK